MIHNDVKNNIIKHFFSSMQKEVENEELSGDEIIDDAFFNV